MATAVPDGAFRIKVTITTAAVSVRVVCLSGLNSEF
jgi:hypothetical protein